MANSQTFTLNIKALFDAGAVKAGVSDIQKAFNNIKLPDNLQKSLESSFNGVNKALNDFEQKAAKGVKTKADAKGITTSIDNVIKEFTKLESITDKIKNEIGNSIDLSKAIKLDDKSLNQLEQLKSRISNIQKELASINTSKLDQLNKSLQLIKSGSGASKQGQAALELFQKGDVEGAIATLDKIIAKLNTYIDTQDKIKENGGVQKDLTNVTNSLEQLGIMRTAMAEAKETSAKLIEEQNQKVAESAQIMAAAEQRGAETINNAASATSNFKTQAEGASTGVHNLADNQARLNTELEQVKSRITYFLGLSNAINLVRRAVRSAFNTIKELDAAMTETAVVTQNTVADMWAKLPEYTKRANELGVSTLAAYKSATLYYQQGLNDDQAAALSVETLKMARIAGLEAAEATDRMTNALRGFNMELNATNAQRVDDVYSQLAAMSASNVDEISTAMTKVASLAHNANMEFETTSAFLAQIIETTRESAETAGTALKTVVARFSEVKKLYSEDQLKGTDEEGQGIDVNKISTALHTAGIDLNKYFLGEVGLDDIFMELASKWDNLTSVQQRYIATQAAGSRQQSRFIALMQDYARTQELVAAAYEANGASAKQFEKTQDSLESKLARLKNAWNEFLMGITNSGIIKGAVSALTTLLNIVNKITGAFGEGAGGFLKFIAAAGAIGGLRHAFRSGGIAEAILGSLGNGPVGRFFGLGGNTTNTQIATAGAAFHGEVVTAGAEFAAAVRGAAGTQVLTGGANGAAGTGNATLRLTPWEAIQKFKEKNKWDSYDLKGEELARTLKLGDNATGRRESKTLFGAVGNAFKKKTTIGGKIAKLLGGSGSVAGASGAATLAATLGTVTVAAVAAAAAIKAVYDASPQGQLKNAQKLADVMSTIADTAKKTSERFKKTQEEIKSYNEAVEDASSVSARDTAIQDRNDYITRLLEEDKTYAQYLSSTFENGQLVLTLDEDALAAAADKAAKAAVEAAVGSRFAEATVFGRQANVYEAQMRMVGADITNKTINDYNSEGEIYSRAMTNAEIAKYTQMAADIEAAQISMRNSAKMAYSQLIDSDELGSELSNSLAEAMAQSFEAGDLDTANWSFLRSRGHWRNQYLDLYGTEADNSMKTADIARAVKQAEQTERKRSNVEQLEELLTGDKGSLYQAALDAFNGTGKMAEVSLDISDTTTGKDILSQLGIDLSDTELTKFAVGLETNLENLNDVILDSAKKNKEVQKKNKANLYTQALQNGITVDQQFQDAINNLSPKIAGIISNVTNQAAEALSSEDLASLMPNLFELDEESLAQYTNFFDNFDLNDPISAFKNLKEAQRDALTLPSNDPYRQMLDNIEEANKAIFDSGNLVQSFILSSDYDSLTNSLSDFIKENGKITSKNIEELADSCSDLKTLLDENVVSAQGLAEAFTLFENGSITIDTITTSLLSALGAGESFETLLSNVGSWIKDFNEGTDFTEGTEHIISELEKAGEYIQDWQFGNEPLENIYDHIFGQGKFKEYMDKNWDTKTYDQIEAELQARIDRITKLAENEGLGALQELNGKLGITGDGTNFNWDLSGFDSAADAIHKVAVELGVGEDAARAFIESWASHMYGFKKDWQELNYNDAINAFVKGLGDGAVITQQELDTLASTFGKDAQVILDAINSVRGASEPIVVPVNWSTETGEGLTGDALMDEFYRVAGINIDKPKAIKHAAGGNLSTDPRARGRVQNADGTYSTVDTFSRQDVDGQEVLVPTVIQRGGQWTKVSQDEAWDYYKRTGQNFGKFRTPQEADAYAKQLHESHEQYWEGQDFLKDFEGSIENSLDAAQLSDYLTNSLKLSPSQAEEVANNISAETGKKLTKDIEVPVVTQIDENTIEVTSETITIEADSMAELTAAENIALEQANYENVGKLLAETPLSQLTTNVGDAISNGADAGVQALQTALNNANLTANVQLNGNFSGILAGLITGASGGIVKSLAAGSASNSLSPGVALTGEEGPEIVWNKEKGYAYVTGEHHPELQNLQPGDRVFNAQETKKILRGAASGGIIDSFAKGGWKDGNNGGGSGGGSGGGNGGKDKEKEWKNDLDWLYNLMEDIEELLRDQKALEEQYEDYLEDQSKTGQDLYKLLIKQLGNLYTQLQHQQFALEKREQEMREFMDVTNDKDQYLWYNWQDRTIEIDWDAIDQITDEEEYKHVKELIDEAEEIQKKMDDADDAIMDIQNQIQELENIWRDTFVDFEKRVLDALIKSYQKVIDNYSELNDTLNDSNSQILDALQKEISLQRQIRDNTKTEEDIANDEARLAYLRRDTSGGNDLSALELEKSLEEKREDYSDNLIDQAIDRLSQDNEAAAQQRERQIEIMQAQLDYQSENGEFNAYVRELLTEAMGADGELLTNSDLVTLLKQQENWDAMSDVSKQIWDEELTGTFKQVAAFLLKENAQENGTFYTALTNAIEGVSSAIGSYSQAMVKIGTSYTGAGGASSGGGGGANPKNPQSVTVSKGLSWKDSGLTLQQYFNPKKYATGGLNTETGLAWLDGTPQEPEYVLNARQTDAFLKLADVLPDVMTGSNSTTTTFGNSTFNLSINVDKIASDYDVDHMCDLVKEKLYDSGAYRNVNSLSFLR